MLSRGRRRLTRASAGVVLGAAAAACSSGGSTTGNQQAESAAPSAQSSAQPSAQPSGATGGPAPRSGSAGLSGPPTGRPTAQSAPAAPASGNAFFPLTPGFQSVREGAVNKGNRRLSHRLVFTVTGVTKEVDGVRAVVGIDQDFDGGELAEQSLELLAADPSGDVRYLGSYTETYEGGQFVNATDSWLAGVRGGKSGVLLPASPKPGTGSYTQAVVPGEGPATAKVVKTGERTCVPFRCFTNVVVTQESGSEQKYYAAGVGGILTVPLSGDPQETEKLVNVTTLSPQGLAEYDAEVLKLDRHARSVAREVFGASAPARRTS